MDHISYLKSKQELYLDIEKLSMHPIVEKIATGSTIKIKFKTGVNVRYDRDELMSTVKFNKPVKINQQFNTYSLDQDRFQNSVNILPKDYENSAVFDRIIAINVFIDHILNSDFAVSYPYYILKDDFESIIDKYYIEKDGIKLNCTSNRGRSIQEQFTNFNTEHSFVRMWKNSQLLYRHILKLMKQNKQINRTTLLRSLNLRSFGKVGVYLALFKKLNLQYKWVHDVDCYSWAKAIAASKLNMHYSFSNPDYIDISKRYNEFLEKIGYVPNTEYKSLYNINADILLLDGNFNVKHNVDDYMNLLGKTYKDILYISNTDGIKINRGNMLRENIFIKLFNRN